MAISKFAREFAEKHSRRLTVTDGTARLAINLDESLQEVREVLAMFRLIGPNGCWCLSRYAQPDLVRRKDNDHDPRCQRARALTARLAVEK